MKVTYILTVVLLTGCASNPVVTVEAYKSTTGGVAMFSPTSGYDSKLVAEVFESLKVDASVE